MSRVGVAPVVVPRGVNVDISARELKISGAKGELFVPVGRGASVREEEDRLIVERASDAPEHRAMHGLTRALLQNAVTGVSEGFSRSLRISGVGYRAALQGANLSLQVGYSHPVVIEPEEGIQFEVPTPTSIIVRGIDKQRVGQVAANIRSVRPPEPYKGKGISYEGEQIRRKAGKAG